MHWENTDLDAFIKAMDSLPDYDVDESTTKKISLLIDIPIEDKQTQKEIKQIFKKVSQIIRHKYPTNIKIKIK